VAHVEVEVARNVHARTPTQVPSHLPGVA